jgi:cardiolipin synthase A/B
MRKTARVLVVIAIVIGIVVLVSRDPSTIRLDSAMPAEDPKFVGYVAALTASPMTSEDRYEVLVNGDRAFPAMLEAIRSATRRVNFVSYIYADGDEISTRFTNAFLEARTRGVEVNIVVDAYGGSISREDVKRLRDARCTVGRYHPLRWYSLQEASYRMHRKLLVADGRTAFTGGIGIDDQWQGNAQDKDHWRDMMVRIDGPAARNLEAVFYESLSETSGQITPRVGPDDDAMPAPPSGSARSVIVASAPNGGAGGVKRLFLLAMAGARKTLDITTPYFITDDSTRWALEQARQRGVTIRVLVEGDRTDAKPVKWASRADYEQLMRAGLEIYEYQPTMMHAKSVVVDGVFSIIGSANFDNRSLDMNDELNVGVQDPELARTLTEQFNRDLAVAKRLTLDEWRQRPLLERANEKVWSVLGELF